MKKISQTIVFLSSALATSLANAGMSVPEIGLDSAPLALGLLSGLALLISERRRK